MPIIILLVGMIIGLALNLVINILANKVSGENHTGINNLVVLLSGAVFLVVYLRFGLNGVFFKGIILGSILIVVSFVDYKHRIIPDGIVVISIIAGILFSFQGDISIANAVTGALAGGGIMFLLGLIPRAMGGGDIKLMFGIGLFLGLHMTLWALLMAFILASVISVFLLLFRIKGRRDHIPFGPFLALGSFLSFIYFR